ncbi:YajQ family cyclic di-GMP-binding protein [Galenea microaerophila]
MPSFDIVSEIDKHELINAVDQANREVDTRYDFRGTESSFELGNDNQITMKTESEFQLEQMYQILIQKLNRRGIDIRAIELQDPDVQVKTAKQVVKVREGLEAADAKQIIKMIKDSKLKVQAANQGDSIRVTGKKRDDLQQVMQMLKESEEIGLPLQFKNFKD